METFEEWFKNQYRDMYPSARKALYIPSFNVWSHQQSKVNKIQDRLREAEEVIGLFTKKVNSYEQDKMIADIKPLVIKNGGYQNAYTLSNLISGIGKARKYQTKYMESKE